MAYFKHATAIVESDRIGAGTRVWAHAHVLPGALIGSECNICDGVFVENDVVIGDRVTIKCGVQVWDGVTLEEDVFVGPNVTFTNDPFPRSKVYPEAFGRTVVRAGSSIGANATILPGITLGRGVMVAAGAVVTRSVPDHAVIVGNPARVARFTEVTPKEDGAGTPKFKVVVLPVIQEDRGTLSFGQVGSTLPFEPRRYFAITGVPGKEVRGLHAHKACHQFLVCLQGSCRLMVDDGAFRQEFLMDSAALGIHIPPGVWGAQYQFSPDALLMVLASDPYDPEDYLGSYDTFLAFVDSLEGGAYGER